MMITRISGSPENAAQTRWEVDVELVVEAPSIDRAIAQVVAALAPRGF
jgi:hypothetical protein